MVRVQGLLLFIWEEQSGNVGRHAALQDVTVRLQKGLPRLFYRDIPYMPIYVAAGMTFNSALCWPMAR